MVIVIRTDLKMSTGKMIAQASHAALSASEISKKTQNKQWYKWIKEGAKKVVLEANSLEELQRLAKKAENLDIIHVLIHDAGYTEVKPNTVTVLGLGPDQNHKLNKITGNLPLLK
jgi:PTH2 family peptidyl-tRNA hydrolase